MCGVSIKSRIRRLEEKRRNSPKLPCEECHGLIIYKEIAEDGTSTHPYGGPCPTCDSRGTGRRIGRIVADMRGWEDRTERGGPLGLGEVYEIEGRSE